MTTIDQRILIPAAQNVVWAYISDVSKNPSWQADCQNVSFLTSKRDGPGTRWRYATGRSRDYVVEITAWYNGLGYEYVFIDGPPYRNNRGRIRLQEIAEGTIVQWTFSYEVGGLLAGMRSGSRQIENMMAASLKTLYRQIKQVAAEDDFAVKSLVRDAPDVEARSQYVPRHPTVAAEPAPDTEKPFRPVEATVFDEPPISDDDGQAIQTFGIEEPPVAPDDTRPRPAVAGLESNVPASAIPMDVDGEPDFLDDMSIFQPPRHTQESVVAPPVPAETEPEPEFLEDMRIYEPPRDEQDTPPRRVEIVAARAAEPEPVTIVTPEPTLNEEQVADIHEEEIASESVEPEAPSPQSADPAEAATQPLEERASIWDVFGVPRPSETQEMKAAAEDEPVVISATSAGTPTRQGLRIALRRKLVHLRRPL